MCCDDSPAMLICDARNGNKKTSLESERLLRDVFVWNEVRSFFESGRGGAGFAVGTNAFEHIVGGVQMKALGE